MYVGQTLPLPSLSSLLQSSITIPERRVGPLTQVMERARGLSLKLQVGRGIGTCPRHQARNRAPRIEKYLAGVSGVERTAAREPMMGRRGGSCFWDTIGEGAPVVPQSGRWVVTQQ